MQKPPPPRPKSKSSDDIEVVDALDAAESRATMALRLMNDERQRAEAAEAELERLRQAEVQRQLDTVVKAAQQQTKVEVAPETKGSPSSMRPGVLTVQAKGMKVGIPLALLVPLLGAGWAGVQNYLETQRQVKVLNQIVGGYEKRFEEQEKKAQACSAKQEELRNTVSQLSGWFVAVLPSLGIKVPPTVGAESVPVQIDPLPLGARRPAPVTVRTPLPAPKPTR